MAGPNHQNTAATMERPSPIERDIEPELDRLAARYTFRDPDEVRSYLRIYPHLVQVLVEATEVIPRYFGEDAPLALEVFSDPEGTPEDKDLFAYIGVPIDRNDAFDRLDRFDDEWWFERSPNSPGVLVFDTQRFQG